MRKRTVSIIVIVCLTLLITLPSIGAMSLSNFGSILTYQDEFTDVTKDSWYYSGVRSVYERGIMTGKRAGVFDPAGMLTIAETIKIAASLHKGFHTGSMDFPAGSPWYAPYVEYALDAGIPVGAYRHMNSAATRSDFAIIIAGAVPEEAVTPINRVADGAIPDVQEKYSYGQAVYRLYRAGILTGSNNKRAFLPGRSLTRAEAATIIARIVDANTRVSFSLLPELTAEQIYKLASPAVFYVEVLDGENEVLKTGSGVFITETGLAITNYHVVIGASSVRITTDDGVVRKVSGIYDYDWKKDIALIQIEGNGFPYLETADSSLLRTGATVFTLGSPLGLQASFTKGIVSQALREIEGSKFIQLDAPISSGSSGGALIDTTGRVVGVTSATMTAAQNINLAVPVNCYAELSRNAFVTFKSVLIPTAYYDGYFPAPDFGVFFNVKVFDTQTSYSGLSYSYRVSDLPGDIDDVIDEYAHLIEQNLFDRTSSLVQSGNNFRMYYNTYHDVMLSIGLEAVNGIECLTVNVS